MELKAQRWALRSSPEQAHCAGLREWAQRSAARGAASRVADEIEIQIERDFELNIFFFVHLKVCLLYPSTTTGSGVFTPKFSGNYANLQNLRF